MSRLKTLTVLSSVVAMFALSATPASAWFSSTQSQGNAKVITSGVFNYAGQGKVTCPAKEIVAQWHIGKAAPIKVQQEATTEGPHLNLQVKKWGPDCTAEIGTTKIAAGEIEVKECDFQLVQEKGSFTPTGGVATPCLLKIGKGATPLCEIQVPAGMETSSGSGKGINVGLSKGTLENKGANIFGKINAEEGGTGELAGKAIFAESVGKNALCTLKKVTEESTLTSLEGELEGVKAV
jgi:hypothetical protein